MHRIKNRQIVLSLGISLLLLWGCGQSFHKPDLVELNTVIPDVILDIRYATANNFVGEVLYPSARCFLIREVAVDLAAVQEDLKAQGYRLKVFDGYRPLSVQRRMWEILPDPNYVADPATGSRHNRGYSVDVSLCDMEGNELIMPSEFDEFTERAHRDYMVAPPEALLHRQILEEAMQCHNFTGLSSEWWHFDHAGYEDKPNLDIPIDEI
jgi:D-alanyl-D-alanine dipeptidase